MGIVCYWRGHKWNTVDAVDVPPVSNMDSVQGVTSDIIIMLAQGYKRVHQECTQCGERRVRREF